MILFDGDSRMSTLSPAGKAIARIRVEDESSMGRSYSKKAAPVPGLGAARATLRTKSVVVEARVLPRGLPPCAAPAAAAPRA